MKVLHLPCNMASQISVTVRALRRIGVEARGLALNSAPTQASEAVENHAMITSQRLSARAAIRTVSWWGALLGAIRWADVIHWHFSTRALPLDLDLRYICALRKARIIEFWGNDVRIPEVASRDNPYVAAMYQQHPELARGAAERSRRTQARFALHGFQCLVPDPALSKYVHPDIFPSPYFTRQRVLLSNFQPRCPHPHKTRPLLVHCPSDTRNKGTAAVLGAISQLQKEGLHFDFRLIHNVPHAQALSIVHGCDLMLDQFVLGAYGLAALEAMAMGKPTLCYIEPRAVSDYPRDLPIVNTTQDDLLQALRTLLRDGPRRHEIGRRSRAYVEKYHDAVKLARGLVAIYEELLEKQRRGRR